MQTSKPGGNLDGYRALFDPQYLPAVLVGREKERNFLKGFLLDDFALKSEHETSENQGTSIMVNGLRGVGKATLVRKVMQELCKDCAAESPLQIANIWINCSEKDESQLLLDLMTKLAIEPDQAIEETIDIPGAWSSINAYLRKATQHSAFNLFFNNVENVSLHVFNKLASKLKNLGLNLLMATSMRHNNYFIDNIDLAIDLDVYKISDLHEIVDHRARIAFPEMETDVSRFITDAVVEFDSPRPGPCINVLKYLYPHLQPSNLDTISLDMVQECVKNALPEISYNELELAEFFANATIEKMIFLDNVVSFHETSGHFYVSKSELHDLFINSCESLEIEPDTMEFDEIIADMMASNIFMKSNQKPGSFFTMIPPRLVKSYIDVALN
ncbi:MAG TPA: hypothetical protein VKM55_23510 [Candidatus Lokiarchaeia archaeon]|nr:hypothetical protein [Candidatus Lokiarchaeia archaeon]